MTGSIFPRRRGVGPRRVVDMKIGFIGTGNIGAPIAGQLLQAGHVVMVHDVRRAAADALVTAGAVWAPSPAALAGVCEVVATWLPGPKEIEVVCLGPDV